MLKNILIILCIFIVSLIFSSGNETAYSFLESSTPGILGAILGGIFAGISIIFSVLLTLSSKEQLLHPQHIEPFLRNLKTDILVLLACLILSLLLPYFRIVGIPLLNYPIHQFIPPRDVFYTALELTSIIISATIIIEILNIMLLLIKSFLSKNPSD